MNPQNDVYSELARSHQKDRLGDVARHRTTQAARTEPAAPIERGRARVAVLSLVFSGATVLALIFILIR